MGIHSYTDLLRSFIRQSSGALDVASDLGELKAMTLEFHTKTCRDILSGTFDTNSTFSSYSRPYELIAGLSAIVKLRRVKLVAHERALREAMTRSLCLSCSSN